MEQNFEELKKSPEAPTILSRLRGRLSQKVIQPLLLTIGLTTGALQYTSDVSALKKPTPIEESAKPKAATLLRQLQQEGKKAEKTIFENLKKEPATAFDSENVSALRQYLIEKLKTTTNTEEKNKLISLYEKNLTDEKAPANLQIHLLRLLGVNFNAEQSRGLGFLLDENNQLFAIKVDPQIDKVTHLYPKIFSAMIDKLGHSDENVRDAAFLETVSIVLLSTDGQKALDDLRAIAAGDPNPLKKQEAEKIIKLFDKTAPTIITAKTITETESLAKQPLTSSIAETETTDKISNLLGILNNPNESADNRKDAAYALLENPNALTSEDFNILLNYYFEQSVLYKQSFIQVLNRNLSTDKRSELLNQAFNYLNEVDPSKKLEAMNLLKNIASTREERKMVLAWNNQEAVKTLMIFNDQLASNIKTNMLYKISTNDPTNSIVFTQFINDTNPGTRIAALYGLYNTGNKDQARSLALNDADADVRQAGVSMVAKDAYNEPETSPRRNQAVKSLQNLALNDRDEEVRATAVSNLTGLNVPVYKNYDFLHGESSGQVRLKFVYNATELGLRGANKDPHAAKSFLREVITHESEDSDVKVKAQEILDEYEKYEKEQQEQ